MNLTDHFTLEEMTKSATAMELEIDNTPTPYALKNLKSLCVNVLEPLRALVARPVIVISGYRSPLINSAIGGASNSQHQDGEAADIEVPWMDNRDLALLIAGRLKFDQLILEFYKAGEPSSGWVHVSWSHKLRHQVFTALKLSSGKTEYQPIIELG